MKCLECNKTENEVGLIDGVAIGECAEGHRTGKLSEKQEKALDIKLGFDFSDVATVKGKKGRKTAKRAAKAIPGAIGDVIAMPRAAEQKTTYDACEGGDHNPNPAFMRDGGAECIECGGWISDDAVNEG